MTITPVSNGEPGSSVRAKINNVISATNASSSIVFAREKANLPSPVDGVITLESGKTYFFTDAVDLTGDRLVTGGVVSLIGSSSETASITSTGLGAGVPLLTSRYSLPIRGLTFRDVGTAIDIDDDGGDALALDWLGVNFLNVTSVGTVGNIDNVTMVSCAFLSSQGLSFTGTVGTVGILNSFFSGNGSAASIITVAATATVSRRFRIVYSSMVASGSTTALNVSTSSTIPVEGYILDTVNFSGGGTYLGGRDFDDPAALFVSCVGITNTTAIAQMFMKDNSTATVIASGGNREPMAGTTQTATALNQRFTHISARNALRYDSTIPRLFRVLVTFSLTSTVNNRIGVYIGKMPAGGTQTPDDDRLTESEVYITASGSRPDAASVQALVEMTQNDELYVIVQNATAGNNVTVEFANMIVERTN